jgi:hypothetical protein
MFSTNECRFRRHFAEVIFESGVKDHFKITVAAHRAKAALSGSSIPPLRRAAAGF